MYVKVMQPVSALALQLRPSYSTPVALRDNAEPFGCDRFDRDPASAAEALLLGTLPVPADRAEAMPAPPRADTGFRPGRGAGTPSRPPAAVGGATVGDPKAELVEVLSAVVDTAAEVERLPIIPADNTVHPDASWGVPDGVTRAALCRRIGLLRSRLRAAWSRIPLPLRATSSGDIPPGRATLVGPVLTSETFLEHLARQPGGESLAATYRQLLPRLERAALVLQNLERIQPTPENEVAAHFLADGSVKPGHEDVWVTLTRGRQIETAMAIKRSRTAGGFARGTNARNVGEATDLVPLEHPPRPTQAEVRTQVARGGYLPEYTTAPAHSFGQYGALVVARARVGDLVKGSASEGGWCLHHQARIDPLFVIQIRDRSFWIQGG